MGDQNNGEASTSGGGHVLSILDNAADKLNISEVPDAGLLPIGSVCCFLFVRVPMLLVRTLQIN